MWTSSAVCAWNKFLYSTCRDSHACAVHHDHAVILGRTMRGSSNCCWSMKRSNFGHQGNKNATSCWKGSMGNPRLGDLSIMCFSLCSIIYPIDWESKPKYGAAIGWKSNIYLGRTFASGLQNWQPLDCSKIDMLCHPLQLICFKWPCSCSKSRRTMSGWFQIEPSSCQGDFKSVFTFCKQNGLIQSICLKMSIEELDTEIAALTYTIRKLWSRLRALWRNSPTSSSSASVQALKDMMKTRGDVEEDSILQMWGIWTCRVHVHIHTYIYIPLLTHISTCTCIYTY